MNAATRLAVFGVGLAVAFGAALGVGRAIGPVELGEAAEHEAAEHGDGSSHGTHDPVGPPGGLAASQDGYTMEVLTPTRTPGRQSVTFTILGPDGRPVTEYEVQHEKRLHLVAVNRDLTGFQHVHPVQDDTGAWEADLDLVGGSWRLFADFVPEGGENLILGRDLVVTGGLAAPTAEPVRVTDTIDGYTVALSGQPAAGEHSMLTLTVTEAGRPVTDLEPYLGAYGHLVALREADLAYLHVHPEDGPAGPAIEFGTEVPSNGRYRLFLDFKHRGVVHTADFVVEVGGTQEGHDDHDH